MHVHFVVVEKAMAENVKNKAYLKQREKNKEEKSPTRKSRYFYSIVLPQLQQKAPIKL